MARWSDILRLAESLKQRAESKDEDLDKLAESLKLKAECEGIEFWIRQTKSK